MKIEYDDDGNVVRITLSRRNLMTLLTKLDLVKEGHESARTILREHDRLGTVFITAEEDDEHYVDRPPGVMHPDTEERL